MDESKKYIKMCHNPDIQKLWKLEDGDCFADVFVDGVYGRTYISGILKLHYSDTHVWLPYQDQLQRMLNLELHAHWTKEGLVDIFRNYYYEEEDSHAINDYMKQFTSMEQLWLAIVMSVNFHKKWDDNKEEWIKEK